MLAPCKDCTERFISCHATCTRYKDWKSELAYYKERITRGKVREGDLNAARQSAIKRCIKSHK